MLLGRRLAVAVHHSKPHRVYPRKLNGVSEARRQQERLQEEILWQKTISQLRNGEMMGH